MNIVDRAKEKYYSLSLTSIEEKVLSSITENYKILKELSDYSLSEITKSGEIINQIISFTNNSQSMVQLIEQYSQQDEHHNLRISLAAIHRVTIQLNLIASGIEMNHKQDEIPPNYLGLLHRTWSCFIPMVLDYLYITIHPGSSPLICQ